MFYKVRLYLVLLLVFSSFSNMLNAQNRNQVGYMPNSEKRVFFSGETANSKFVLYNFKGKLVYKGNISEARYWENSGDEVCFADFSSLTKEGDYTLKVEGFDPVSLKIDKDIYQSLGKDVLRVFYHARASMPLTEEYAGKYAREAGHPDDKVYIHKSAATNARPEGTVISSKGGWYDAGDYNKYIVNSSISVYTLLQAENLYAKSLAKVDLNIPESGNGISDLLNETLYNLRWMLTMQDPNDGGVYHKLTSKKFCGMVMPDKDLSKRYVVMKSSAATLDFAATMSAASRVLRAHESVLPGLADSCLQAAEYAWQWTVKNPTILYKQPEDIKTGEYKDKDIEDERFWAASELYLSTGKNEYKQYIDFKTAKFNIPQWGQVSTLALYSICTSKTTDKDLRKRAQSKLIALADKYYKNFEESPYRVSIVKFPWGSNGRISNQGMLFLHAFKITGETKYRKAADACLSYILGANPTTYCFVTGYGQNSPLYIHERVTESNNINQPLPGFLAGGATKQAVRDCGAENYPSTFPAKSYLDKECSYSTNEIAINWNSPLAFLISGLNAESKK